MSQIIDPNVFLKDIIGKSVVVKLDSGITYHGILASLDGYLNISMEQTQEYFDGQLKNTFSDTFIRGNNEVPKDCSQQDINQSFHKKAEIWHPYRIKNNPLGEENYKKICQAYIILKDEDKRREYNEQPDKVIPFNIEYTKDIITIMFGEGKFKDIFDNIFETNLTKKELENLQIKHLAYLYNIELKKKCELYSSNLMEKINYYLDGNEDRFFNLIKDDINSKIEVSAGPELLAYIGELYVSESKRYKKGLIRRTRGNKTKLKNINDIRIIESINDFINNPNDEDAKRLIKDKGLYFIWTMGLSIIEIIVRRTCKLILNDRNLSKYLRSSRMKAIKLIGTMYKERGFERLRRRKF